MSRLPCLCSNFVTPYMARVMSSWRLLFQLVTRPPVLLLMQKNKLVAEEILAQWREYTGRYIGSREYPDEAEKNREDVFEESPSRDSYFRRVNWPYKRIAWWTFEWKQFYQRHRRTPATRRSASTESRQVWLGLCVRTFDNNLVDFACKCCKTRWGVKCVKPIFKNLKLP